MTISDTYYARYSAPSCRDMRHPSPSSPSPSPYTKPSVPSYLPLRTTYTSQYGARITPLPSVTPRCPHSKLADLGHDVSSLKDGRDSTTVQVASILSRAHKAKSVRLKWDMAFPLAQSFDREARVSTLSSVPALREPALSTTTHSLIVVLVGYPYEISVNPSSEPSSPPYVTALDVLSAVYTNLGTAVAPSELNAARKHGDVWSAISSAYTRRTCGDNKKPFKRIDFLAGKTVFLGIEHVGLAGKLPKLELAVCHRPSA